MRFGGRSLKPSHSPQTHFFKHFLKENIMNLMNTCRKYGAKLAVVAAAPLALATQAWAEVPESVKTDLATAKTDALSVAAIVLGIIASIFAIQLIRRVLR